MWIMIAIYCGNKKVQLGSRVGTVGNILFGYDDYRINSEQRTACDCDSATVDCYCYSTHIVLLRTLVRTANA